MISHYRSQYSWVYEYNVGVKVLFTIQVMSTSMYIYSVADHGTSNTFNTFNHLGTE